jgi:zinc transport system substrate-binding protein
MYSPYRPLLAVAVVVTVAGCSGIGGDESEPQAVAAMYPFAYVAERISGGHVAVDNLTSPGVEPHDLELSPQQVADISEAELLVYQRGFQPAVDDAVDQNEPDTALDVAEILPAQTSGADGEAHGDDEDPDHEGDPHIWLDPTLMVPVVEQVEQALADLDPEHADAFAANAQQLVTDLERLDRDFEQGLADCDRRIFVTSHAAFGYLAARYDLEMAAIAGLTPDVEPSPQQLAEIQRLIESEGITTVFTETLGSQEYADTLAQDLGVRTAVLDPVEGLVDDGSDEDYFSLMRANLAALQEANGC